MYIIWWLTWWLRWWRIFLPCRRPRFNPLILFIRHYCFTRHNAMSHDRLQYSVCITFICTGKPNKFCDSLYYNLYFIEVVQKQTHSISEVCPYTDLSLGSLFCYLIYLTIVKPKPTSFFNRVAALFQLSNFFKIIGAIQDP